MIIINSPCDNGIVLDQSIIVFSTFGRILFKVLSSIFNGPSLPTPQLKKIKSKKAMNFNNSKQLISKNSITLKNSREFS